METAQERRIGVREYNVVTEDRLLDCHVLLSEIDQILEGSANATKELLGGAPKTVRPLRGDAPKTERPLEQVAATNADTAESMRCRLTNLRDRLQ